jgi:plasmid replication initiation protein
MIQLFKSVYLLDVAIREINAKTDLKINLVSIERSKHRRVVAFDFAIKTQPISKG